MSFKITIEETRVVQKIIGKRWETVGQREVERDERYCTKDEPKTRIEDVRGYTPEVESTVEETNLVLSQTVDTLDLPAVIKAINNL